MADCWQMAEYLPLHCRQWLLILVRRFVLQPHLHSLQHRHAAVEEKDDCCRVELLSLLRHIESQLYSLLPTLNRPGPAAAAASASASPSSASPSPLSFPLLAGQHLQMTNPALEFTKQICHLLSLEADARDEVRRLRENLLRLLSVNAWSPQAAFVNPCLPVVLRQLVCAFCNVMKDVDLCRNNHAAGMGGQDEDADRPAGTAAAAEGGEEREAGAEGDDGRVRRVQGLYCEQCHHQYDARVVEERLLRRVRQRLLRYSVQDLLCCACGSMADRHLQLRCDCSGDYQRSAGGRRQRGAAAGMARAGRHLPAVRIPAGRRDGQPAAQHDIDRQAKVRPRLRLSWRCGQWWGRAAAAARP